MPNTLSPEETYFNDFADWRDVSSSFTGFDWSNKRDESERRATAIPQPDEVILADYNIDGYEGSALVIYRNADKFYVVEGGHCSCYGLSEVGWEPEEYTLPLLIAALEKRGADYGLWRTHASRVLTNLKSRTQHRAEECM